MIIKRKSFSFNVEGALNGAKNGAIGGSLLGLASKSPKSGGKLALLVIRCWNRCSKRCIYWRT